MTYPASRGHILVVVAAGSHGDEPLQSADRALWGETDVLHTADMLKIIQLKPMVVTNKSSSSYLGW